MPLRVVVANRGLAFDGDTPRTRPLGGVESATAELAEALARRGHDVAVHNDRDGSVSVRGVAWKPLRDLPWRADLFIANRDHELLLKVPFARQRVLWMHNPGSKSDTFGHWIKTHLLPPAIVVLGDYHRATLPSWLSRRRIEIIRRHCRRLHERSSPRTRHATSISCCGSGRRRSTLASRTPR
jgi:glycosyltransferase involved in cell wall biosynthesis